MHTYSWWTKVVKETLQRLRKTIAAKWKANYAKMKKGTKDAPSSDKKIVSQDAVKLVN